MEVMLQWVDELDDLVGAARHLTAMLGYRLLALAGVAVAGTSGVAIGLGVSLMMGG